MRCEDSEARKEAVRQGRSTKEVQAQRHAPHRPSQDLGCAREWSKECKH